VRTSQQFHMNMNCTSPSSWFSPVATGIRVRVKLTPNAGHNRIDGIVADAQGNGLLRVAVNAVPEQGRANRALIAYLAKQWRLPKSSIILTAGAGNRTKTLHIEGDGQDLMQTLDAWAGLHIQTING